jgi:hypothetical protein
MHIKKGCPTSLKLLGFLDLLSFLTLLDFSSLCASLGRGRSLRIWWDNTHYLAILCSQCTPHYQCATYYNCTSYNLTLDYENFLTTVPIIGQGLWSSIVLAPLQDMCNQWWLNFTLDPHNLLQNGHLYFDCLLLLHVSTISFNSVLISATFCCHSSRVY